MTPRILAGTLLLAGVAAAGEQSDLVVIQSYKEGLAGVSAANPARARRSTSAT